MATPKKSEVGGTPDSTIAIMATTNFYSNCHSNVFTELPLPDSKALSNIQYMLDLSFTDLAYMTFWCIVTQTFWQLCRHLH